MADRTEGAEELARALRADRLSVLTCDVVAIPERAARVDPFAVVVDIEQPNAAPVIARVLESANRKMVIAAIGTVENARRLNLASAERARLFTRPLALGDLLGYLRDIARLDGLLPKPPPSSQGTGTGVQDSDSILLSDFPAIAGLPDVEGILPELDGGPISTKIAGTLSPEIEQLLVTSARRVEELEQEHSQHSPEPNILVPPDMLALVDDLLSSEEPPATRGGMDLAAMLGAGGRGEAPFPPAPSSHSAVFDSQPWWHTGVPEAPGSDLGSIPTALASDDGEATGLADRDSDRQSEAPGTAIGEETSVPAGGTVVGHSSPLESGPKHAPSDAPPSGSLPPLRTEPREAPSDVPSPYRRSDRASGSSPPARTESYAAKHPGGPVRLGTDDPPDSSLVASSEMAPMTRAGAPIFSSRHPASPPVATLPQPASVVEAVPDSHGLTRGDPFEMLATAVRRRATGALVMQSGEGQGVRRVLMRDGDMVNAASENEEDALVSFLVERGDLSPDVLHMRSARLPHTGRHAAAALIANGFLGQDDLWPVLRAHAEWIIARALSSSPALGHLEREPPDRLRAEPNVFGGAAGVEVFIESVRRVLPAEEALRRLGGPHALLGEGPSMALLAESALTSDELDRVHGGVGRRLSAIIDDDRTGFEAVVFALVTLGILEARPPSRHPLPSVHPEIDPLDADAVRARVQARMALVHEADYFSLLGVGPAATGYEIRRAFLELRRSFEPKRLLTAATADLHDDVTLIVEVLEEAYHILRDPHRRNRYRRALEASGPASRRP